MTRMAGAPMLRAALAAGAFAALMPAAAPGAVDDLSPAVAARFVPGEVLVRYDRGTSDGERAAVRREIDAELEQRLPTPRLELLALDRGDSVIAAVAELESDSAVSFAEPNFIYGIAAIPDDTSFNQLWGLHNSGQTINSVPTSDAGTPDADIDATEAWDDETGGPNVVVGVVDSGVAMSHPDLDDNIWANPGETGGGFETDLIDNDMNGKVDDHRGWDFVPAIEDNDPSDEEGHGTHVAGTIGAEGNNATGVAGVNWDVSLMPLRVCNRVGTCSNADLASAFTYAGANGADVVNASISGPGVSSSQQAAVNGAPDTLFVFAAGNDAADNDASPQSPCNLAGTNVICVASSTLDDGLTSFSNFGAQTVDLAAPGGGPNTGSPNLLSTYPLVDRVSETFANPLGPLWLMGGTPNTWARSNESSGIGSGFRLTDSPGGSYVNNADNHARAGPVDLSTDMGCHLRYDLELELAFGDQLNVEASTDAFATAPTVLQTLTVDGLSTQAVDIPTLDGQATAYIRFRLISDAAFVDDGVHIDNVRIRCPFNDYTYLQGTSMASPHVAGAGALLIAEDPTATVTELRGWLLDGVDLKSSLEEKVVTGGRLNLDRSLDGAMGMDIHRPETTITASPPPSSTNTTASFSFVADEPATFTCSLDGSGFTGCASGQTYTGLAVGDHSFSVRAMDGSGNLDLTPDTESFTVLAQPIVKPAPLSACEKLRKKLKKATTVTQKRKLRKKIKKQCPKKA